MSIHYNTLKAVCPKGHPYDEANTIITPAGGRRCRACRNAQAIARNYRYRTDNPWGYRASQLNMKSKRLGLSGRVNADELALATRDLRGTPAHRFLACARAGTRDNLSLALPLTGAQTGRRLASPVGDAGPCR